MTLLDLAYLCMLVVLCLHVANRRKKLPGNTLAVATFFLSVSAFVLVVAFMLAPFIPDPGAQPDPSAWTVK